MIPPMQPNKSMSSLDGFRSNYSEPPMSQQRRAYRCALATVCLLAVGVMAVGAAVVVRQYSLSRPYEKAVCRLANVTYGSVDLLCSHCTGTVEKGLGAVTASTNQGQSGVDEDGNRGHASNQLCFGVKFPCVRVIVDFVAVTPSRVQGRGLLYSDTAQASGEYAQCSYSVCYSTRAENVRLIDKFVGQYSAAGSSPFDCYYDTETADNVVATKVYTRWDVIHCMLWPSLLLVACLVVFIYMELHERGGKAYNVSAHGKWHDGHHSVDGHLHPSANVHRSSSTNQHRPVTPTR